MNLETIKKRLKYEYETLKKNNEVYSSYVYFLKDG